MISRFACIRPSPLHPRPAARWGVGLPVFQLRSLNNSPPVAAREGPCCRSPERGLGSCAPPGRGLTSPSLTRLGGGNAGLRRVRETPPERLRDKHRGRRRKPGRDARRETPRQRQTGCRDIFRERRRQREGQAGYTRRPGGHGREHLARTRARTPAHTRSTLPPPPPLQQSRVTPPRRVAGARAPITRVRACRAGVLGAPGGPSSRTRSASQSVMDRAGPAPVTPGHPSPQWTLRPEEGAGPGAHPAGVQAPGLPSYLGFLEGRDGPQGCVGGSIIRLVLFLAHFGHG